MKTNASEFEAFSSPNHPPLGRDGIELTLRNKQVLPGPVKEAVSLDTETTQAAVKKQCKDVQNRINGFPVMQLNAFPARYNMGSAPTAFLADLIMSAQGDGVKGIVLLSYGEGSFPSGNPDHPSQGTTYLALEAANTAGVTIVDATQVLRGVVNDDAYAAGAWLPDVGALGCRDMTPMTALAKLMILLTIADLNSWSPDVPKRLLQLNLAREVIDASRLDARGDSTLLSGQAISALDGSAKLTNEPRQGPGLRANGEILWKAFANSPEVKLMPGRLTMQTDGNLAYYSRYNSPIWSTNTA